MHAQQVKKTTLKKSKNKTDVRNMMNMNG